MIPPVVLSNANWGPQVFEVDFNVCEALAAIDAEGLRIEHRTPRPEIYWFYYLRSAMAGLSHRLYGTRVHYNALHSWWPPRHIHADADYHLANALFNMDSALECFVFGINALGNGTDAAQFKDVTDERALRNVRPTNVIGPGLCPGYATYFPSLQAHWMASVDLIEAVVEYHDVTKHRHAGAGNGQMWQDPPPGFSDGLTEFGLVYLAPYAEIILGPEAKQPIGARTKDWRDERYSTLEKVMVDFKPLIETSLELAVADAKKL